jgi:hypothetical protein
MEIDVKLIGNKHHVYAIPSHERGRFGVDEYIFGSSVLNELGFRALKLTQVSKKHALEFKAGDLTNLPNYVVFPNDLPDEFTTTVPARIFAALGGKDLDGLDGRTVREYIPYHPSKV